MSQKPNPNNYGSYFRPPGESIGAGPGSANQPIPSSTGGPECLYESAASSTRIPNPFAINFIDQSTSAPNAIQIGGEMAAAIYKVLAVMREKEAIMPQIAVPIGDVMMAASGNDFQAFSINIQSLTSAIQSLAYAKLLTLRETPTSTDLLLTEEGRRLVTTSFR